MRALPLLLLLPGAALAQDATPDGPPDGPPLGEAVCRELLAQAGFLMDLDASGGVVDVASGDWCEVKVPSFAQMDRFGTGVDLVGDRLRFRGEGLSRLVDGSGLPSSLEVELTGLRSVPFTGDPVFDWLLAAQGARAAIDARLALKVDDATGDLLVTDLRLDLPGRNEVAATATLAGLDLSRPSALLRSERFAELRALDLSVTTDGLFEQYLLLPLGEVLLDGPDPGAEAEALRSRALAALTFLPDEVFVPGTGASLAALLAELPNPRGTLDLRLRAESGPGLGPGRLDSLLDVATWPPSADDLRLTMAGLAVEATWTPLPPEAAPAD